jgi:hypothetical protein
MPLPSRQLPPLGPKAGPVLRIARQHFDALVVMLAVSFYFEGAFRFRAVGRILSIGSSILGRTRPDPCHTTVRLWAQRIGLHRLRSALVGPRWVMICDHTATFGALKLFVICGVDIRRLEQRMADKTGDFSLSHRDVRPLAVVPMKNSSERVAGLARPLFFDNGEDFVSEIALGQVVQELAGHGLFLGLAAAGRGAPQTAWRGDAPATVNTLAGHGQVLGLAAAGRDAQCH